MTRADFMKEWGTEVRRLEKKGFIAALLQLMDAESPARKLNATPDNDLLHGGVVFASKTAGHEGARKLIAELPAASDETFEPEDKFATAETI